MDELIRELREAVRFYDREAADSAARKVLAVDADPVEAIERGLAVELRSVGERYGCGKVWFLDLVVAAQIVQSAVKILEPEIRKRGAEKRVRGRFLIGTVAGDIHDIGKNIVGMLLMANGFEVIDLGVDVPAETFVEKVEELKPDFLGLSSLLTSSLPELRKVIDALNEKGLRDEVKIVLGGAAVTPDYARAVGADVFAEDAVKGVNESIRLTVR
jgi:corrinoid protein of di/trimethylamine methyltransferase